MLKKIIEYSNLESWNKIKPFLQLKFRIWISVFQQSDSMYTGYVLWNVSHINYKYVYYYILIVFTLLYQKQYGTCHDNIGTNTIFIYLSIVFPGCGIYIPLYKRLRERLATASEIFRVSFDVQIIIISIKDVTEGTNRVDIL